ncbi:MAG: ATP-dependent DNA helicase RecG [Oscillospiraceae bacterium]|nr:ATP-dependent DNA helicase RecG [Oscillospiraceae bacterium]
MAELYGGIRFIKGIGEQRAKNLEKLGIKTLYDLISYFPRDYEDRSQTTALTNVIDGEYFSVSAIVATTPQNHLVRRGMELLKFDITDGTARCGVTFFNQSYLKSQIRKGETYRFYGKFSRSGNFITLNSPIFEKEGKELEMVGRIMPVYRLTAGISQKILVRAIRQGLDAISDGLPETIPESTRRKYGLIDVVAAYNLIHDPKSEEDIVRARTRLIFEELFVLSCALQQRKYAGTSQPGFKLQPRDPRDFYVKLPFEPTDAQKRVVSEAFADMSSGKVMNRLVQGDVGSGKTAVAAACCWFTACAGLQSAFMAPTEILAEQHYATLSRMLEPFGIRCSLLTGHMTKKQKNEVYESLKSGETDVVIGTHALLSEGVEFRYLGLVVADEQHRFGVRQRTELAQKGDDPHVLIMSATPIPRTLALIIYGELDVSVIDQLPPGRQKIDTFAVKEDMRERINKFIARLVGEGRQVYIICPAIDENEMMYFAAVESYYKNLSENVFPNLRVACLHGRMKAAEKEEIMRAFKDGETDILVSTTVIEVGVDVPNAALIVVENADRFGLSQLHQLRGRVGRGEHKSYCVLFNQSDTQESAQRLAALCKLSDGFKISEVDLTMRGPGDFFGSRQSGLPATKLAELSCDTNTLYAAQEEAKLLFESDPELKKFENRALAEKIRQFDDAMLN